MDEVKQVVFGGCVVHTGSEAFSSKMCGLCGRLNESLGSSEVFKCPYPDCYYHDHPCSRDGNGAHNIEMLSYLHGVFPLGHDCWKDPHNKGFVPIGTTMSRKGILIPPTSTSMMHDGGTLN